MHIRVWKDFRLKPLEREKSSLTLSWHTSEHILHCLHDYIKISSKQILKPSQHAVRQLTWLTVTSAGDGSRCPLPPGLSVCSRVTSQCESHSGSSEMSRTWLGPCSWLTGLALASPFGFPLHFPISMSTSAFQPTLREEASKTCSGTWGKKHEVMSPTVCPG